MIKRNIDYSQYREQLNKIGSALGVEVIWETDFEEKALNYQGQWLTGSGGENCSWQLPFEGSWIKIKLLVLPLL